MFSYLRWNPLQAFCTLDNISPSSVDWTLTGLGERRPSLSSSFFHSSWDDACDALITRSEEAEEEEEEGTLFLLQIFCRLSQKEVMSKSKNE